MNNEYNQSQHTDPKTLLLRRCMNILMNLVGSSLLAFGVCAFVSPFNLIVGGATGISLVTHRLLPVNVSTVVLIINLGVLPLGWLIGGKKMVLGSVLSSLAFPLALGVFERIPAITTIADNNILATLCGGIVCGFGIGLVMKSGSSTGGLDIPCIAISKATKLQVGTVMNVVDTIVMLCQIPLSGLTNILYGILYTAIMTKTINATITMGESRLRISIISEAYDQIRWALIKQDYGVTTLFAESGYTKTPIMKIESVMRSTQYRKAQQIIEEIDPTAFITIEYVKDVKGRGFTMNREWLELD